MQYRMTHALVAFAAIAVANLLAGCPPATPNCEMRVTVTITDDALQVGDTAALAAVSTDDLDVLFAWTSSPAGIVEIGTKVEADGTVGLTATGVGIATITATGVNSGASDSLQVTVEAAPPPPPSHAGRYTSYQGSKTCNGCHPGKAEEVHASVHYQWYGETPDVVNMDEGGKLTGMNDFCTGPAINWIGLLTNLDGLQVSGGCAQCHVGFGAKPTPEVSQAQLENIDCLMCHSRHWKRKVIKNEDGSFAFAADEDKMQVSLLEAITDIERVSSDTCISCHAYAGGGQNNKRGDIEEAHRNASREFDVHMAPKSAGGAGLVCTDCHTVENHRFAGRGIDLRPTDLDVDVRCTNCHDAAPHASGRLNAHTARVDCTTCHIPHFSRGSTTEMHRDFSVPEVHPVKKLYEPTLEREANVVPEYAFSDGTSYIYDLGTTGLLDPVTERVSMARPVADIDTPGAKIFPYKLHTAYQPMTNDTGWLIPLKMGIYFQTANVDGSIRTGAQQYGWDISAGYTYVDVERYMGIYHEVAPAEDALSCSDCHGDTGRVDFGRLGYTPKETFANKPLCASCHEDRSNEYSPAEFFMEVHEEHVTEHPFDCSICHNFSKTN
ncbi:MAG: hypothetical protein IT368_16225 [Candidatus Hydrogenedentes bacterium]|nr:hypothetical protein [Candidatus Hydrogenedentota bacterium]